MAAKKPLGHSLLRLARLRDIGESGTLKRMAKFEGLKSLKKPKMERDPLPKREQKRLIKLTPEQRKQERKDKTDFALMTANLALLRSFSRGAQGLPVKRTPNAFKNLPSTKNPFTKQNPFVKPKMLKNKRKKYL